MLVKTKRVMFNVFKCIYLILRYIPYFKVRGTSGYIAEATKPNVSLDPSCMHEHDSAYTSV